MRRSLMLMLCLCALAPGWAESPDWALVIHGGAGADPARLSADELQGYQQTLTAALRAGSRLLEQGGTSLECVETVVAMLEDSPYFNAGKGAVFNAAGQHELDAAVMDGRDHRCGAVAGVKTVKNPIKLAHRVMTDTPHVLLAGAGAEEFAAECGVERVDNSYFSTEKRRLQLQEKKKGTVGCVARDRQGNLAAATSTGGLTNKRWGRIGDSPLIGAGTYADNASCAVSCTGTGEEFIRRALAHDVSARMLYQQVSLDEAARAAIASLPDDCGGLIAVDRQGHTVMPFNTAGMARARADSTGLFEIGVGK
ncbi:MAG: isoaspartyl peptidase/L-asparaginase family protein [Vulcanimicrobiota bacterium]